MSENNEKNSLRMYSELCAMLDKEEFTYTKDEERLAVELIMRTDDIDLQVKCSIWKSTSVAVLTADLGFNVPDDKVSQVLEAIARINEVTVNGSFEYLFRSQRIRFSITQMGVESLIGAPTLEHLFYVMLSTADDYNEKLFMITQGKYSMQELIGYLNE